MPLVLTCSTCRDALVARGAVAIAEPRIGSLLDRCVVHESVHATNLLSVEGETLSVWADEEASARVRPIPLDRDDDAAHVSTLATMLLAGGRNVESETVDVLQAVTLARKIIGASKGEDLQW